MNKKKIIVIGSGFGGLSVASRLASKGHDVTIFEKLDKPGGRAYLFEINGFKWIAKTNADGLVSTQCAADCYSKIPLYS